MLPQPLSSCAHRARGPVQPVADGVEVQVSDNGLGLGLSLSHDIVTQGHSGTFGVASQVGQGTTFTIRLPQ